jgi:uncharacterized lipoprotein YmbA
MLMSSSINTRCRLYVTAGFTAVLLFMAGCATTPTAPTASLNEARSAIQSAEKEDASRYAVAELDEARQKLMLADEAVVSEDMILAERLAQESIVTAQLAAARAGAKKAEAVNEEIIRGADALIEEMQRVGD